MTNNLKLGSRWLLPVTIDEIDTHYVWVMTDAKGTSPTVIEHECVNTLIPASTLTDLQAENANLKTALTSIKDFLSSPDSVEVEAYWIAVEALGESE